MADRPIEPIRDGTDRSRSRVGDADENGSYVQTEVFTSEPGDDALVEARGNALPPVVPTGATLKPERRFRPILLNYCLAGSVELEVSAFSVQLVIVLC